MSSPTSSSVASADPVAERIEADPAPISEHTEPNSAKIDEGDCAEVVRAGLEEIRAENELLEKDNGWLRSEIIRLNQALAEAALEVYSLNKKLDAIFKPEAGES